MASPSSTSAQPALGDVRRVEVEPRLEELTGRRRPDRRLHAAFVDERLGGRQELVVGAERRVVGVETGLLEDRPVVDDHHRVRLPRHLVEAAVGRAVLLGAVARALGDVVSAVREAVERDETALALELRHRSRRRVEDEARCVAGRDGGADDLLARPPGRDLLGRDLLVGMLGVPRLDHRRAPFQLERRCWRARS